MSCTPSVSIRKASHHWQAPFVTSASFGNIWLHFISLWFLWHTYLHLVNRMQHAVSQILKSASTSCWWVQRPACKSWCHLPQWERGTELMTCHVDSFQEIIRLAAIYLLWRFSLLHKSLFWRFYLLRNSPLWRLFLYVNLSFDAFIFYANLSFDVFLSLHKSLLWRVFRLHKSLLWRFYLYINLSFEVYVFYINFLFHDFICKSFLTLLSFT